MTTNDEALQLRVFGDALREMLDLDPIYDVGRGPSRMTDVERFGIERTLRYNDGRTLPKRVDADRGRR